MSKQVNGTELNEIRIPLHGMFLFSFFLSFCFCFTDVAAAALDASAGYEMYAWGDETISRQSGFLYR